MFHKKINLYINILYILYLTSFKFRQVPAMNLLHNKFVTHLNKELSFYQNVFLKKK